MHLFQAFEGSLYGSLLVSRNLVAELIELLLGLEDH